MELEDLGYYNIPEDFREGQKLENLEPGRVLVEHKERYIVRTAKGEIEAEITGNMYFTATCREDFPAVGDWVAVATYDNDFGIIHKIFPRFSVLKRREAGKLNENQIIAANIDYAFIIQAIDRDFNINRLERYLTICNSSAIKPVIILSKIDLISEETLASLIENIRLRIKNVPVIAISNESKNGYETLKKFIEKGKTYCMLGSSGVGKSTLLNNLCGKAIMETKGISQSTNKGRHTTSHRELVVLENGGILIDNPGIREVGLPDKADGLESTFDKITEFSKNCRFADCTHTVETGCAVAEALGNGNIDKDTYNNYLKMVKEKAFFESTLAEKRKKEKILGKIIKDYNKRDLKQRKY